MTTKTSVTPFLLGFTTESMLVTIAARAIILRENLPVSTSTKMTRPRSILKKWKDQVNVFVVYFLTKSLLFPGFFLPPPPPSSTGRGLLSFSTGRNLLTANANGLCPAFYKAWAGYPPYDSVPSTELRSKVGFGEWVTNTCAVRGTLSVMNMGLNPGKIGYTKWRAKGKRYLIRVLEMEQFLLATFGKPYAVGGAGVRTNRLDEQRNRVYDENPAIKGKAGIVRYSDCGWSDATGHIDVWDGTNIRGHTYASKCKKIEVWNVCNPVSNPNYAKFIAYLKKTKATYHN